MQGDFRRTRRKKTGAAVDYGDPDFPLIGAVYLKLPMGGASTRVMCYGATYIARFSINMGGRPVSVSRMVQAGAVVTGLSSPAVLAAVKKCQHAALSDKSGNGIILKSRMRPWHFKVCAN